MATLYIQKSSVDDITTPLGYVILTVAEEQVSETLIVMPKRPFGYWNKRFLNALNQGASLLDKLLYGNNGYFKFDFEIQAKTTASGTDNFEITVVY